MNESILLELQNGAFTWLALCATVIFIHYIWTHFEMGYLFLQGAIALLTVWVGQVVIRGSLWKARYTVNAGGDIDVPGTAVTVGSILCIVGFLCVIRVFSEESWKKWAWRISLGGLVVFLTASYYKVIPI